MQTKVSIAQFKGVSTIYSMLTPIVQVSWKNIVVETLEPRQFLIKTVLELVKQLHCINAQLLSGIFHIDVRMSTEILQYMAEQFYLQPELDVEACEYSIRQVLANDELTLQTREEHFYTEIPFYQIDQRGLWLLDGQKPIRYEIKNAFEIATEHDPKLISEVKFSFSNLLAQKAMFNIPEAIINRQLDNFAETVTIKGYCEILLRDGEFIILIGDEEIQVEPDHPDILPFIENIDSVSDNSVLIRNFIEQSLGKGNWKIIEDISGPSKVWKLNIEETQQTIVRDLVTKLYTLQPDLLDNVDSRVILMSIPDSNWRLHFLLQLGESSPEFTREIQYWKLMKIMANVKRETSPITMVDEYNQENNCNIELNHFREFLIEMEFWDSLNIIQEWEDIIHV